MTKGYLLLIHFSISCKIKKRRAILGKSSTPSYISQEILLNKLQHFSSDFFSLRAICYEMGKKPFRGKDKKKSQKKYYIEK